jgi:hypothetical protein
VKSIVIYDRERIRPQFILQVNCAIYRELLDAGVIYEDNTYDKVSVGIAHARGSTGLIHIAAEIDHYVYSRSST